MLFPPLVVGLLKLLPCFTTSSSHHQQWVMQEIWWNGILVSGIEEQAGWIYKPGGFLISFSLLWKSVQCFCGVFLILPRTLIVLSFFAVKMKSKIKKTWCGSYPSVPNLLRKQHGGQTPQTQQHLRVLQPRAQQLLLPPEQGPTPTMVCWHRCSISHPHWCPQKDKLCHSWEQMPGCADKLKL